VHNCVKYSGAATAEFRVRCADGWLTVELRDHGRGFAPGEKRGSGHGLINLVTRAEALGGTATVTSEVGHGATVILRIPLAADRN
jgi:signal transduction histidine kinase